MPDPRPPLPSDIPRDPHAIADALAHAVRNVAVAESAGFPAFGSRHRAAELCAALCAWLGSAANGEAPHAA